MASQTLDETVAALMSMGFEFQDAQDAIQYGKLAVQDAVDWILAGKPGYAARGTASPTLRLSNDQSLGLPSLQPDTSVPFISPMPIPHTTRSSTNVGASAHHPSPSGATAAPSTSDTDMEQQVVSRLHLNDAKLAEKKQFDEKVRADVEKKARIEKQQAKRERDRVLKEIAEDRKMSKMMKTYSSSKSSPASSESLFTEPQKMAGPSSEACASTSKSLPTQCSIQIRLPSGQQLRKKLDCSTTLGRLWMDVINEAESETEGYCGFIQPFPRHEFSAVEMNKTLEQLGLVPSGSLVLRKSDNTAEQNEPGVASVEKDHSPPESKSDLERPPHPYGPWVEVDRRPWGTGRPLHEDLHADDEGNSSDDEELDMMRDNFTDEAGNHYWGRGRRLEGDQEYEAVNNGDDEDMDGDWADHDAQEGRPFPLLQGFLGQRMGAWGVGNPLAFVGVGQRLVPAGVPGADDHVNRRVGDLAAEAAQQRLTRPQASLPAETANTSRAVVPAVVVRRLEDLCIVAVIDRITGQCNPIYSLGRLPESLSENLLQHLVQRHLLDSKTLRLFCSCCLRKLILDTYNYATNDLLFAARLHTNLQVLSLQSCPLINDKGIEYVAELKKLKVLNLGLCKQITNKSLKVIEGFRKLHSLNLEETAVTESGLIQYLSQKPCLRNLNLNRTAVTDAVFQHLRNLEHLETLCLEETKISSLDGVKDMKNLTALNLAYTAITPDSLSHLVDHPNLKHLSLANTENLEGDTALLFLAELKLKTLCLPDRHTVTNAGLAHIVSFPLHTLDLTNYIHVGDDGMEHVGKITSLQTLILSNTKVTDAGLQHLENLTQLKKLHLDRTAVSDVGIRIVKAFQELTELSLSATNVTNRFLKEGILQACKGLTKLNLSRTHVGDKGVEQLALPHLTLLNLDCTGVHARVVDTIRANCPSLRSVTIANLTPVIEQLEEEEEED